MVEAVYKITLETMSINAVDRIGLCHFWVTETMLQHIQLIVYVLNGSEWIHKRKYEKTNFIIINNSNFGAWITQINWKKNRRYIIDYMNRPKSLRLHWLTPNNLELERIIELDDYRLRSLPVFYTIALIIQCAQSLWQANSFASP